MKPVDPFSSSPSMMKATLIGATLPDACQQSSISCGRDGVWREGGAG
jgi:hypothetical protein